MNVILLNSAIYAALIVVEELCMCVNELHTVIFRLYTFVNMYKVLPKNSRNLSVMWELVLVQTAGT
jgi:hypothetical protein